MKTFEEMQVYIDIFSTTTLDGGEYQTHATDAFLLENSPRCPLYRRLGGTGLDAVERRKFFTPTFTFTVNTRIKQVSLKIRTYSPIRIATSY
jgi:hypothetical protein